LLKQSHTPVVALHTPLPKHSASGPQSTSGWNETVTFLLMKYTKSVVKRSCRTTYVVSGVVGRFVSKSQRTSEELTTTCFMHVMITEGSSSVRRLRFTMGSRLNPRMVSGMVPRSEQFAVEGKTSNGQPSTERTS
jgi:hypothetical protein